MGAMVWPGMGAVLKVPYGVTVDRATGSGRTGQRGTVVENRVAIQILPSDDVERRARVGDDEWTKAKSVGQGNGAADKHTVADIEGRAPVVFHGIVGVHDELRRTGASAEASAEPPPP